jgi:hypothetical protein
MNLAIQRKMTLWTAVLNIMLSGNKLLIPDPNVRLQYVPPCSVSETYCITQKIHDAILQVDQNAKTLSDSVLFTTV